MAKKVISCSLSRNSIKAAIKELEAYRDSLQGKCEEFVRRLCEVGEPVALARVAQSPLGKTVVIKSEITPEESGCKAALYMTGGMNQPEGREPFYFALAIEFGAGIYYNRGAKNPKADELGFGVGTYPGQVHAFDNVWYYWDEGAQAWKPSHGVKATMPMYSAWAEMKANVETIAKEVFGT